MTGATYDLGLLDSWWALIARRAALTPDREMFADDRGRTMSFGEYAAASERVAAALHALGIGAGTVVSWQLPTVLEAAVLQGALGRLGAVQNPIIPILRHAEVTHIVGQCKAEWLITPGVWRNFDYAALAQQVASEHGCRTLVVDHTPAGVGDLLLPVGDPSTLPPPPLSTPRDKTMWIYYSSGTTAAPKGARHSDYSISSGSNGFLSNTGLLPDDVMPVVFPITHVGGHCILTGALRIGMRNLLIEVFDPVRSSQFIADQGATVLGSALPFFLAFLEAQRQHGSERMFPKARVAAAGGAPTPPEVGAQLVAEIGVAGLLNSWGLTEFPIASGASLDDPPALLQSTAAGQPVVHVTVRIVDSDGNEVAPGSGGEGELRVDGPQKLLGYVDPSLDFEAFDEKGFFRTGDLGTRDADGFITVTGRLKDIIIRNAENISATEVENVLFTHPDIADVAVVGVPDPRTGERAVAVVVLEPNAATTGMTLATIAEHCRANGLSTQKIPEGLQIVTELPRNAMGKLLKQKIRADLLG
ncbi:MAG: class I adenylate-forming enzyme family protein [Acidimicrobiia bacterium]